MSSEFSQTQLYSTNFLGFVNNKILYYFLPLFSTIFETHFFVCQINLTINFGCSSH